MSEKISLPKQKEGAQSDNCFTIKSNTLTEAENLYNNAKENLIHVNNWNKLAGGLSAKFQLTNSHGDALYRPAKEKDHIKIQLPVAGKHYDWVKIESIEEEKVDDLHEHITIKVRPTNDPLTSERDTAHFLTSDATSSFSIQRKGEKVTAAINGRNELPNTQTKGFFRKIRNAIIGLTVMLGLNTPQWKALAKGLVKKGRVEKNA